jgi:hypothetical protein
MTEILLSDEESIPNKRCNICRESKPLGEFFFSKYSRDGHQRHCKECDRIRGGVAEPKTASSRKPYVYVGVSGGPLISGYIRHELAIVKDT